MLGPIEPELGRFLKMNKLSEIDTNLNFRQKRMGKSVFKQKVP